MPAQLCDHFARTLSIHPQKRPSIEQLLQVLLPYMLQRAKTCWEQSEWKHAQLWVKYLEQHFDEISVESESQDGIFGAKMEQHLTTHLPLYLQTCLLQGITQFHQAHFDMAQQTFLKVYEVLDRHQSGCPENQWNSFLLKVVNNLAACHYKRRQHDEAYHLYKSLSTAEGNFGQIINHNSRVCKT